MTIPDPQGATAAHVPERNEHMSTDNTFPPKLITESGAVYVLHKAPTDNSQLNVDLTVQTHHRLRLAAAAHGITLRDYVENTLTTRLKLEEDLYAQR